MTNGMALSPGDRLGHLVIRRALGRGAHGAVYLAEDTLVGRAVAAKVVAPPDAGAGEAERARILNEARLIGTLRSPHVVTLYRAERLPKGGWLLEMEYMAGGSLEERLRGGSRPSIEDSRRILFGAASALSVAHAHRVVHADVKPANILLDERGNAKLGDFGLGRVRTGAGEPEDVVRPGTPLYMAPEVVMGEPVSFPSDVWSLGLVGHQLLGGKFPFPTDSVTALFCAIQNDPPAPLDGVPEQLATFCPSCGAEMRVVAVITDHEVVDRILDHLERHDAQARAPPDP